MLAKIWKKVLFGICIVACIYNVMHKLVNRISLEAQLKSVQNQGSIIEMLDSSDKTNRIVQNSSNENKATSSSQNEVKTDENTIVIVY